MPKRLRNFVFTINNPTDDDTKALEELECSYIVYGSEVGASGTPHYQGYAELFRQTSFNVVKAKLPTAHIEPRRGSAAQAAEYCKKDGKYEERGTISAPGKRNDLATYRDRILEGASHLELVMEHPTQVAKFPKFLNFVRNAVLESQLPVFTPVKVLIFVGDPGTGKSRAAWDFDPELYNLPHGGAQLWFDGYDGNKTLLIDDFYGGIKYTQMLQLLDGYRMRLPVKGSFVQKAWTTVIITSNSHPKNWYNMAPYGALERRITEIREFKPVQVAV